MSTRLAFPHSSLHLRLCSLPPQAILVEEDRVVAIRFGHDYDPDCMAMDETLYAVSEKVQNFAVLYLGESVVLRFMSCMAESRSRKVARTRDAGHEKWPQEEPERQERTHCPRMI